MWFIMLANETLRHRVSFAGIIHRRCQAHIWYGTDSMPAGWCVVTIYLAPQDTNWYCINDYLWAHRNAYGAFWDLLVVVKSWANNFQFRRANPKLALAVLNLETTLQPIPHNHVLGTSNTTGLSNGMSFTCQQARLLFFQPRLLEFTRDWNEIWPEFLYTVLI